MGITGARDAGSSSSEAAVGYKKKKMKHKQKGLKPWWQKKMDAMLERRQRQGRQHLPGSRASTYGRKQGVVGSPIVATHWY